jgi:hypothetical protein
MRWTDLNLQPSTRQLRQFAGACWLVLGGLAGWQIVASGFGWPKLCAVAIATLIGIVGLLSPNAVRPFYVVAMVVTFPIGWLISNFVLMALFYLLFTPLAVWFRLIGRDVLRLRRPKAPSYWLRRQSGPEPRRYLRQY